jgi:hypothetical protein
MALQDEIRISFACTGPTPTRKNEETTAKTTAKRIVFFNFKVTPPFLQVNGY